MSAICNFSFEKVNKFTAGFSIDNDICYCKKNEIECQNVFNLVYATKLKSVA